MIPGLRYVPGYLKRAGQFLSLLYHGLQRLVRRAFACRRSAPRMTTLAGAVHIRRAATISFPSSSKVDIELGSDIHIHGEPDLAASLTFWFTGLHYQGSSAHPRLLFLRFEPR